MPTALVADAHLGGPGGAAGPLVEQLRALPDQGVGHLVLMGDLFQVWVGERRFETPEIREVAAALPGLRARGMRVDYVEGNRDFFLAGGPYAPLFDSVVTELEVASGGGRVLLVHGDGLNDSDRQYRFWRWLSKSAPVHAAVKLLPGAVARRLVGSTERKLANTNFKHRARIPEEAIRRWATPRIAAGVRQIVLGHFHEERRWQVAGGEVWLLEAWFHSRRVEILPD